MDKLSVTSELLPIGSIRGVYKGTNRPRSRPQHNPGRISDALVFILSGACTYRFDDGTEFTAQAGQILYLARDSVYDMSVLTVGYTFIYCDFDFLSPHRRQSALFIPERMPEAEKLFRTLLACYGEDTAVARCRSFGLLYDIYSLLWAGLGYGYPVTSAARRIEAAEETIRRRYRDPGLSISQLARSCGVSEVYFRRLFQGRFGVTPSRYLLNVRMEKACGMLLSDHLTLEECALQSGFSSASYFCRVFRQEMGITPTAYRRAQRESRGG